MREIFYCSPDHPISINPMIAPYTESQISDNIAEGLNQVISRTANNMIFTTGMRVLLDVAVKENLKRNRKTLLNVLDYVKTMAGNKETKDGIISRLTFLLNDERMVRLLCGNNSIEWGELIAKKQTFILNCEGLGADKMIFLGTLVTNGIASYLRYSLKKEYEPVSLFIDEAHNFVNPNLMSILKEGRKYRISCTLSTQDVAVIDEKMTRVMLNSGNICAYRLGHREANYVAKELNMSAWDVQFLERFHIAYLTPKGVGIAKAPRPPIIKEVEPPVRVEPQRNSKKPSWFTLDPSASYPQPESQ